MERLKSQPSFVERMSHDFVIAFENDANLFAYGEWLQGKAKRYNRSICITIGTGTGSAFIERGQLVKHRHDVPVNGWVYAEPFRDSIVDDYISKRGIARLASELGANGSLDVHELAEAARSGVEVSSQVFVRFGEMLGEMLNPFIGSFCPEAVIIGGQIVRSHDLFEDGLYKTMRFPGGNIEIVDQISNSTFIGVSQLLTNLRTERQVQTRE